MCVGMRFYLRFINLIIFILVEPEDVASPIQTLDIAEPSAEPQYKDKKEAIEAFKELLKEKVYIHLHLHVY